MLDKKTELHIHTKMSEMRGLISPKELVEYAIEHKYDMIAVTDIGSVQAFPELYDIWKRCRREFEEERGKTDGNLREGDFLKIIYGMEAYLMEDPELTLQKDGKKCHPVLFYAANEAGIKNLYRLVSYGRRDPKNRSLEIDRSLLAENREGLLVGAVCDGGELSEAIRLKRSDNELKKRASFYNFIEITPFCESSVLYDNGEKIYRTCDNMKAMLKKLFLLGKEEQIPVIMASDAYYLYPKDSICHEILLGADSGFMLTEEGGISYRTESGFYGERPLHIKDEPEFGHTISVIQEGAEKDGTGDVSRYLEESLIKLNDMVEQVTPLRKGRFLPVYPDAEETLERICRKKAQELYGSTLPDEVKERLDREINSICKNGYAGIFMLWRDIAHKSLSDGYIVGTRGSVASSFAAYLSGITMINPLDAHYRCTKCRYSLFPKDTGGKDAPLFGTSGKDLPKKTCPVCGEELIRDGCSIPVETFMGLRFDREPDIDLNFAPEEQPVIQEYITSLPGVGDVCRAGTVTCLRERTAYDMIMRHFKDLGEESPGKKETEEMVRRLCGVKRMNGLHPGGMVVVPEGEELISFTPLNDYYSSSTFCSTHFEYHSIDNCLLKMDVLGHDDPGMIRRLFDMTGKDPMEVPVNDEKVMSIFTGTAALGITPSQIGGEDTGVLGLPEFGPGYVRNVIKKVRPTTVTQLIKLCGMVHGTGTWMDNAEELIETGTAPFDECIGNRDDVMLYLLAHGCEPGTAYTIMEAVRKGRGISSDMQSEMQKLGVPDWYIGSCRKIRYLFPKAHAASYVKMALTIAWYKVYFPAEFYAAWCIRNGVSDGWEKELASSEFTKARIEEYESAKGTFGNDSGLERLYVIREMHARGITPGI